MNAIDRLESIISILEGATLKTAAEAWGTGVERVRQVMDATFRRSDVYKDVSFHLGAGWKYESLEYKRAHKDYIIPALRRRQRYLKKVFDAIDSEAN